MTYLIKIYANGWKDNCLQDCAEPGKRTGREPSHHRCHPNSALGAGTPHHTASSAERRARHTVPGDWPTAQLVSSSRDGSGLQVPLLDRFLAQSWFEPPPHQAPRGLPCNISRTTRRDSFPFTAPPSQTFHILAFFFFLNNHRIYRRKQTSLKT